MANRAVYCAKVKKRANFIFYANGEKGGSKEKFVAKQHSREKVVKKEFGLKKISEKFNKACDCYH